MEKKTKFQCPAGRWTPDADEQTACCQCPDANIEKIAKEWGKHCKFKGEKDGKKA